jgi:hypothetical protein
MLHCIAMYFKYITNGLCYMRGCITLHIVSFNITILYMCYIYWLYRCINVRAVIHLRAVYILVPAVMTADRLEVVKRFYKTVSLFTLARGLMDLHVPES